ncbi:major facilitator superfamily protein [Klebsormidium nitens]|uniref:Molybdate-anion transporter n=1 Tax=Klebsormidium nitens TaxID=105231 RepID=A0A1Y1I8K1_KLENI|nr:major facilitator superfamily protein [Klebsormidium nitens]|eukprot:GAQ85037.1 major facilitator superfamily protein [Klebsormidium nitens]
MENFYYIVFGALAAICGVSELSKGQKDTFVTIPSFEAFKNNYLLVYSLMMAGDWLQGPYVYALYQHYGYDQGDIGRLFIAGFGSSMVFGTIVGSLADKHGRRLASVLYCVSYILSCWTKHSPRFAFLLVGRILGGIATSLLFSAFESWLVAEHFKHNFEPQWLSLTFSKAIFLGNGLVAILAGLLANFLVVDLNLGPVAPFDTAACFLAIGCGVILKTWPENYGETDEKKTLQQQFQQAWNSIVADEKIALLGAIQALFEGSMYTFVFLWTPALSPNGQNIPHGFIFATFMLASMIGSSIASRLMARSTRVEYYMQYVFMVSSAALLVPVFNQLIYEPTVTSGGGLTPGGRLQLLGFLIFEVCVGIFWPSIMKLRSQYIPEESRSTIMNMFRIPLNVFVCLVLYNVSSFSLTAMFAMCSGFLVICALLQKRLSHLSEQHECTALKTAESDFLLAKTSA